MNKGPHLVAGGASEFSYLFAALPATQTRVDTINDTAAWLLTFAGSFALGAHLCQL